MSWTAGTTPWLDPISGQMVVMCSLQLLWLFEEQDEATTGFSLPNTEVLEDSSFFRIIELLTRALSSRLLWISRLIETSTYFQCIVRCSIVLVRVYHDKMQTEFDRQISNFCRQFGHCETTDFLNRVFTMPFGILSFLRTCRTFANTSLNFIALNDI